MIDIHSHTNYSDGSDSVEQILKAAQDRKLEYFSVTDHNTIEAYNDEAMIKYPIFFEGKVIPGIEITTTFRGGIVEVLGYGFDLNLMGIELKKKVLTFEEKQTREFKLIKDAYQMARIMFNEKAIVFDPKTSSCRKSFWKEIITYPENVQRFSLSTSIESSSKFTRDEVYNPNSDYYVDETSLYPSFQETIDIIHRCDGIAILAHLHIYTNREKIRKNLLQIVENYKLDGVECYYSTFTKDEQDDLEDFCKEHSLLRSGGSDYHGTRKPGIQLGCGKGMLNVSASILTDWPQHIVNENSVLRQKSKSDVNI